MSFLINPYAHQAVLPAATVEYVATQTAANTSSTSFTFSGCNIGSAAVGRRVFAAIGFYSGTNRTVTSVTIGGVAATIHAQIQGDIASSSAVHTVVLASVPLDAGTTADIVVTMSGSSSAQIKACATYKVTGLQSDTAIDTDTQDRSANAGAWSGTIDVDEDGVLIAATFCLSSSTSTTYDYTAGVDDDASTTISSNYKFAVGSLEVTADETGRTVTINGSTQFRGARAMASFR